MLHSLGGNCECRKEEHEEGRIRDGEVVATDSQLRRMFWEDGEDGEDGPSNIWLYARMLAQDN